MRILIALILVVALIVGVGFYRGWFHLSSQRAPDESNVTLTVDKDKVQSDAQAAREKVVGAGEKTAATADTK